MDFDCHLRKLEHWMVSEFFQLLANEFGKVACNMFLESSRQALCVVIKGDQKLNSEGYKIIATSDQKRVLVAKLLVTKILVA